MGLDSLFMGKFAISIISVRSKFNSQFLLYFVIIVLIVEFVSRINLAPISSWLKPISLIKLPKISRFCLYNNSII